MINDNFTLSCTACKQGVVKNVSCKISFCMPAYYSYVSYIRALKLLYIKYYVHTPQYGHAHVCAII